MDAYDTILIDEREDVGSTLYFEVPLYFYGMTDTKATKMNGCSTAILDDA